MKKVSYNLSYIRGRPALHLNEQVEAAVVLARVWFDIAIVLGLLRG